MKEIIKKTFLLGLGVATMTKNQTEKIVRELVSKNAITVNEGRDMLKKLKNEALIETNKVRMLVEQEAKRVAGMVSTASKIKIVKVKDRLRSINQELTSKGKDTLKKILKELSK